MPEETICPVTGEVCRTHWCHNSFDCAEYDTYKRFGLTETSSNSSVDVFDATAMKVIEGISL